MDMVAGVEVMHGLGNMDLHSLRLSWLLARLSTQFPSSRETNTDLLIFHCSQGDQLAA